MSAPSFLNVHTPSSSFAIVHSLTQGTLPSLFDQLSRKVQTDYHGERVGPGWLKYGWNDTIWNLDDDADYTIFVWRQQQTLPTPSEPTFEPSHTPTPDIHLQNPSQPLPTPPAYLNPAFYLFQPSRAHPHRPHSTGSSPHPHSSKSNKSKSKSKGTRRNGTVAGTESEDSTPEYKKRFQKFHAENGVRTVVGSIGPVNGVRMLLKSGYRHVYISRKFAMKHGFIPSDAAPGHYGYGGLVNIGVWPITLTPAQSSDARVGPGDGTSKKRRPKPTQIQVYLSEEQHFDVVLGRSFLERRQIQFNPIDPTDVLCLDTGEQIECELVILKDGRGEIVTVT